MTSSSFLRLTKLVPGTLLAMSMAGCQLASTTQLGEAETKEEADQLYPQPAAEAVAPEAREVNDSARLLAGLPPLDGQDTHKKWRSESFWQAHKIGMDKMWNDFGSKRGVRVRKWAASELADVSTTPVVFQPFGGPDFVFSHLLFPDAETFVVCGSAPSIDLPKLDSVSADVMADTVFALRAITASFLKTTNEEPAGAPLTNGKSLPGSLPMLLATAARTGHVVESIELMPSDDSMPSQVSAGEISLDPLAATKAQGSRTHPSSACVITMRTGAGKPRRIFYFQQDLTDSGLPESAALLQYLNKQNRVVVVVNESAHELHQPNTLRLQQYIAKHAVALVQDPSGVPYRHFSPDAWNIQRYGSYAGAPPEYREFDQPELIAAYNDETSKPQTLPFGQGMIGKELPAALMVARPLVTNPSELPVNVEVAPLSEPVASESPALSVSTAPSVSNPSPPPAVEGSASAATAPVTAQKELVPPISPIQTPSAVEASLAGGAGPLAPIDLAKKP